jgi:hypothetical protein
VRSPEILVNKQRLTFHLYSWPWLSFSSKSQHLDSRNFELLNFNSTSALFGLFYEKRPILMPLACERRNMKSDESGLVVRLLATDPEARVRLTALPEKKVLGLERGPLSLVSTTEELLDGKVADPV